MKLSASKDSRSEHPKSYHDEFKRNAVELLVRSHCSLKHLAEVLGISHSTLREWRDQHIEFSKAPKKLVA